LRPSAKTPCRSEFPDAPHERDGKDDWGSERQIEAQNLFFEEVQKVLSVKPGPEEMVAEGLRVAKKTLMSLEARNPAKEG
jgi:hypothetical protein